MQGNVRYAQMHIKWNVCLCNAIHLPETSCIGGKYKAAQYFVLFNQEIGEA